MPNLTFEDFENDELIIFNLIASGYTIIDIAEKMKRSKGNINKKIKNVIKKFNAENKVVAMGKLINMGLVK